MIFINNILISTYKDGRLHPAAKPLIREILNKDLCEMCNVNKAQIIRHKDHNNTNHSIENLQMVCSTCHAHHHDHGKKGQFKKGHKHSEESKRKMSESSKGKVTSEETKKKLSIAGRNRPKCSESTRLKLSKAVKASCNKRKKNEL